MAKEQGKKGVHTGGIDPSVRGRLYPEDAPVADRIETMVERAPVKVLYRCLSDTNQMREVAEGSDRPFCPLCGNRMEKQIP